jgi:hypothetical protein
MYIIEARDGKYVVIRLASGEDIYETNDKQKAKNKIRELKKADGAHKRKRGAPL